MLMTGRDARRMLLQSGLTDRQARRVLGSGLLTPVATTAACHLFDQAQVRALAARPVLTEDDLREPCPGGYVVARREDAAVLTDWAEQAEILGRGWSGVGLTSRMFMNVRIHEEGALPFLATLSGLVYFGADLVGGRPDGSWVLAEPGAWFDRVRDARVPTPAGRPWHFGGELWNLRSVG